MSYVDLSDFTIENYTPRKITLVDYNREMQHIITAINTMIDNINYIKTTIQEWHIAAEEPTMEEVGVGEVWLHVE